MEGKPATRNVYTASTDTPHTDMINNPPFANPTPSYSSLDQRFA